MAALLLSTLLLMSSIIVERQKAYDRIGCRKVWDSKYDYIVIGSGSAGSVVAARLSQNTRNKVLLLEAGGPESVLSTMPSMSESLQLSQMDWNYTIVAQNHSCFGLNNRIMNWPRGRVLGGTSSINRMAYLRGNPKDFENWEKLGAKGWSWERVFPFFLKSEYNTDSEIAKNGFHSTNGSFMISTPPETHPLTKQWVTASESLGYPKIDLNGKNRRGTGIAQRYIWRGVRQSASEAYLAKCYSRRNLHILTHSFATKIIFDGKKRAKGVEFRLNGKTYKAKAHKEVIVSAGTINSPQLLMLSGIGPKSHLEKFNIDVISDLPVGDNLQDHPRVNGVHFLVNTTFPDKIQTLENLAEYFINGSGPLTLSDYSVTIFQSSFVNETDWPDVQLGIMQSSPAANPSSGLRTGIRPDIWDQFYGPYRNRTQFSVSVMLLRPKSRGNIRLASTNPLTKPLINPNYFAEPQDLSIIIEGISEAFRISLSPALNQFNVRPYETLIPGCEAYHNRNFSSPPNEYLRCMAQTLTSSAAHMVGTCRMGASDDKTAVVDPQLRVRGVSKLRVIDASIMPAAVSANTNAATVMIGEYGSQLIINDSQEQ